MSIHVALEDLADILPTWGQGFVLTTVTDTVHIVSLYPRIVASPLELRFAVGSGRAARNIAANPATTILFAPHADSDGYSLIVDGTASIDGDDAVVVPTSAVLHRPAPNLNS